MMSFAVKPKVKIIECFEDFWETYGICDTDIILTNKFVLPPHVLDKNFPGVFVFQEQFGAGEPNDGMIDGILDYIGEQKVERIIAIGGGTILDIAKLLVFGPGYHCEELFEKGNILPKKYKLIAVPTTCGTGSEMTGIAIAEIRKMHTKLGLATEQLFPDEAVLIAELLKTMPYPVFASSSIDALIHAIEAYISVNASPYTDVFAKEAICKIISAYRDIVDSGKNNDVISRCLQELLVASNMAGIAFGNAGCGAVHALSYPIGANFHVPHGKANYLLLNSVFRMYKKKGTDLIQLEQILAQVLKTETADVWNALEKLLDEILEREPLKNLGMTKEHLKIFPKTVIQTQQRLLKNMPIVFEENDIYQIYKECMGDLNDEI